MPKLTPQTKKQIQALQAEVKTLETKLVAARKAEGKDSYIDVKVKKNQARFTRVKKKGVEDKAVGKFYLEIDIKAKEQPVFVPLSVASGKKTAGFMYQIEGTAAGTIVTTDTKVRGDGVTQVTVGTLLYAKIPAGKTASFAIQLEIRGAFSKTYQIVFTRLNYKLALTDARYQQYLKPLPSKSIKFS